MILSQLDICQVRNLAEVKLSPSPGVNLIFGANASGKTSLLEAIHILSTSRSFRTLHVQHIIQHEKPLLRIVGKVIDSAGHEISLGIERDRDQIQMRLAGETVNSASKLASVLPVQVINPDVHKLLEQGPKYRRQYLDWGVFHVEHSFHTIWREYNRNLRQRNAAIRARSKQADIQVWDKGLIQTAEKITDMRENYLTSILPVLGTYTEELIGFQPEFSYSKGWQRDENLAEKLKTSLETDMAQGYTRAGPHRADLHIKHNGLPVQASFSRGQQKLLVSAMRLAQITHLKQQTGQHSVILVDDLAAELDEDRRARLLALLRKTGAQLFVTVTEADLIDVSVWERVKMFHVEHGEIKEVVY